MRLVTDANRRWWTLGIVTASLFMETLDATITGMAFYRVANGQLSEHWVVRDHLGLLQQVGILPTLDAQPA